MISLEEYLSESLLKHLYIDYNIIENAGLYDGIEDLCKFLTNKIRSHQEKEFKLIYKDSDRELSKMKNVFFKSIILDCERSNKYRNDAECVTTEAYDFDKDANKVNYIELKVYLSQTHNQSEVYSILLHEMTHAWDNYNHIKRYSLSLNNKDIQPKYRSILKSMDDGSIVGKILYFINPLEVNAWVASFAGYLYEYMEDNTISDPHKALQIIKNSELYDNYVAIGQWINAIYDNDKRLKPGFISEFCNEYNKIYGTNYTEQKIRKIVYQQYNKVMNKIESSIGKLCVRYVKTMKIR